MELRADCCLNIGGIANISFLENGQRLAFDVAPANQLLNHLSATKNLTFDKGGELARSGHLIPDLLKHLNAVPYYKMKGPKSLANEQVRGDFIRILNVAKGSPEDKLRTTTYHIAEQIHEATRKLKPGRFLITGGGAFNTYLIDLIKEISTHEIIILVTSAFDDYDDVVFAVI